MPGIDLPSGIKTLNPVPVEFWSGPYTGADETAAKLAANTAIPSAVRFLTMEVSLIIAGIGYKYWYKDGIADLDLVKVDTDISNLVTLNTNQTITGIKSFQNESLTLFGINGGGPHIVSVRADDGGGTIIFEEVGAGGDAVVAYRSWVTNTFTFLPPIIRLPLSTVLTKNCDVAESAALVRAIASAPRSLFRPLLDSSTMGSCVALGCKFWPMPPPCTIKSLITRWNSVPL